MSKTQPWQTITAGLYTGDKTDLLQHNLRDAQRSALPLIAIALVAVAGAAFFWMHDNSSEVQRWDLFGLFVCLIALGAWLLRDRHPLGAWFLAGGTACAVLAAFWFSGISNFLLLLPLPCILVISYMGTRQGAIIGLLLSLLLVWLATMYGAVGANSVTPIALLAIWGTIGLLWIALRPLRTVTAESWYHFTISRQLLEESRNRQQELNQAYEDLRNAYKEMGRLNQVLLATQRAADEARQAKESFVANVSHELRTPLNMIIGFSSLIADAPLTYQRRLPAHLLADVAAIQRNAEHLSSLVDDVLDLSKADAGQMALSLKPVQVAAVLEDAVQPMRELFASKSLWLKLEIAANLPEVLGDSTRIRQVVMNLLSNAGKIVDSGGATISAFVEQNEVVVQVEDTGPGIAPDEIGRLFEPFRQLETRPASAKPGTGLGLAISKKLVELHGGRMWVEPRSRGAAFFFSLPIPLPLPASGRAGRWLMNEYEVRGRRPHAELPPISRRLLFVGTENRFFSSAMHYLGEDYELALAPDVTSAVADLQHASAQMLVLNEMQAVQTEVSAALGSLTQRIPIVTCPAPSLLNMTADLGVDGYLIKPIARDTLLSAVAHIGQPLHTILIVDDQPEVIQLFSRMLASAYQDCTILRAEDGRRALELIRTRQPDLMLLDLGLPGLSGHEIIAAVRHDPTLEGMRIIVTSAQDPAGEPVLRDHITLFRASGFSSKEIIQIIAALAETVSPFQKSTGQAPPDKLPG